MLNCRSNRLAIEKRRLARQVEVLRRRVAELEEENQRLQSQARLEKAVCRWKSGHGF